MVCGRWGSELQRPEGWGRLLPSTLDRPPDLANWWAQRALREPPAQYCRELPFREKTRLLTLSLRRVQNEASR